MAHSLDLDDPAGDDDFGRQVLRKVSWRLVPFLCLLYIFNILDRANVGFARLTMQADLGLSKEAFDFGYGLFYAGYLLFEVPSNLLMRRFGARLWIARIMVVWGIVSAATMFAWDATSLYVFRVLLGIAEAGFFPGIILYLTYWYPARERAGVTAFFMTAIGLASMIGNPISGAIMDHLHDRGGWHGWQWLFLLEGIPSVLLGIAVLYLLPDTPADASWLEPKEKEWLSKRLSEETREVERSHDSSHLLAMLNWRVWWLICLYFTVAVGANAFGAYSPTLIKDHFRDADYFTTGLIAALPHLCAVIAMTLIGMNSDRTGERAFHVAFSALLAAIGWSLVTYAGISPQTVESPWIAVAGLCLAQAGMMSMLPTFWSLPTTFLTGVGAAAGIALINSVANIGGIVGPLILGTYGPWSMTAILGAGVIMAAFFPVPEKKEWSAANE